MKKIKNFFIRLWRLITNKEIRPLNENKEEQINILLGYSPLTYNVDEVNKALESYKDPIKMINDCRKYGVKNEPNQSFFSYNKTEQVIKEQLYDLLYQYEWQGNNDKYQNLITNRIEMFKEIYKIKEKERIDDLIKEGRLCPICNHGALENKYTGLVKIIRDYVTGGNIGAGVHISGTGSKEFQFHYKKCDECDYLEMYEYRETPSWWDDLWNIDCPFSKGDIIKKYQNNEFKGEKYKSHNITRW